MALSAAARPVGRLVGLWRYPVKSLAAEALTAAEASWHGIAGDRRFAFVRAGLEHSGFPWLTLRQRADLRDYVPSFDDPSRPDSSAVRVRTPSGCEREVTDPALAAELDPGCRVIRLDRGAFDAFPLSLISTGTLARLGELAGQPLEAARFRPNLLIEADGGEPFVEDSWVGWVLRLGGLRLRIDKRDGRCLVITLDPETGERSPAVLRAVAEERQGCAGVYASVVTPGRVAVGDELSLEPG